MQSQPKYQQHFHSTAEKNPKIYMKPAETQNSKSNPRKQKIRDVTTLEVNLDCKVTVVKTARHWCKNRHADPDPWSRTKDRNNPSHF